ncbi:uncharacterized protein B0H18DRAFT_985585 [Fomitopsis serialis]|uniref:uncharacterized protein n=1 Tax=Fomitopsis serialis TaxID=139415 RepID=UPI002007FB24|nr:uncharacterized protein B0H18DRAFT_985585 [Neoantrodia serialis]KAH9932453.1 hypothetical protein B0H18DRAFT_985585 [Neoantrodia serialis]
MSGSSARTPPPPYRNDNAEELKRCFATLLSDQQEIQNLFKSVSGELETTPQIGEHHPLTEEWNTLRQRHRRVYRDSQHNASQCASFLHNFVEVVIPLSHSKMPYREKRIMVTRFLEAIAIHQENAKKTAEKFNELGKDVETFQLKIAAALRSQAESQGFFTKIWSGLEELCMTIWQALYKLLTQLVKTFHRLLSGINSVHFSVGPLRTDIRFHPYSEVQEELRMGTRGTASLIKDDCRELTEKLTAFEDAWEVVKLSCSDLLINLAMAKSMSAVPAAFDSSVRSAQRVYSPLVECMRAYSQNRSPEL